MPVETVNRIVVRTYEGEDLTERISFVSAEASDSEVDLIVHPFTADARTISMSIDQAWALARELARMASAIENRDE